MTGGDRSELLGLEFERAGMSTIVARCLAWCHEAPATHIVATANASHLCLMRRDPALRAACQAADLAVADGMSVVWALRLLGRPVRERIAGIDLMTQLLEAGSRDRLRVYFLGARPEVVERLLAHCRTRYPGLDIAGSHDGYFGAADEAAIVADIRARAPHFLFIGMPSPFKEVFAEQYRGQLRVPVVIGVGGSFDVLAGVIARAPAAVQSLGFEWAWRLLHEPRKLWRRYLTTNSEFIWLVWREFMKGRS